MQRYLKKEKLLRRISGLKKINVLVVGDIILDHYIWGNASRLSPEAPVPVVWANNEDFLLGGASNVAFNLASLGSKTSISGVVGSDFYGRLLKDTLLKESIDKNNVVSTKERPTTLKARVIAKHQQVVRIDWESTNELSLRINKKIIKSVKDNINKFDAVIIEDYGKGVVNPYVIEKIVNLCKKNNKIVTVDPKENHIDLYKGVTALTPNLSEARSATNMKADTDKEIDLLGEVLLNECYPEGLLITLGERGMRLFLKDGDIFHLPTYAKEVFDVSGAGDTVIAVFTAALATGASLLEASFLANVAASIVVERVGASSVTSSQLCKRTEDNLSKILAKKVS